MRLAIDHADCDHDESTEQIKICVARHLIGDKYAELSPRYPVTITVFCSETECWRNHVATYHHMDADGPHYLASCRDGSTRFHKASEDTIVKGRKEKENQNHG